MSEILTKVCKHCGEDKPVALFPIAPRMRDGYDSWCKGCHNDVGKIKSKEYAAARKAEKIRNPKWIIYRVTNTEDAKIYIGITSNSLEHRKKVHYKKAEEGSDFCFPRALRKYPRECFIWEEIDTAKSLEEANGKEKEYIVEYRSKAPNGYNLTDGGDGTFGIKRSEEHIKLIKENSTKQANDPSSKVYQHIESQKIAIVRSDGVEFKSMSDAARATGARVESVHGCVHGNLLTTRGYTFWAKDDKLKKLREDKLKKHEEERIECKKKIIDNNGVIYNSLTEAHKITGAQIGNISKVLSGVRKSTLGLTFKFLGENTNDRKNSDEETSRSHEQH
jgi:hypothetical protein